jgi:predicted DNA-binding protein
MRRTNIYLPEPMLKALKALAKKLDVSVTEIIRRAIEQYLRNRKE